MNDENYQNNDNSTGTNNNNNADNIDIENKSVIDTNNIDECDELEEIDELENEQNISEIFNENSLEYDDTIFSDESVVLIQYTPSEMNVIESEYTKEDCIKVLSAELNTISSLNDEVEEKESEQETSNDENENLSKEDDNTDNTNDTDNEQEAEETPEELEAKLKKRRRRKIIIRILKTLLIILCIIFIAVGAVMVYYYEILNSLVYDNLESESDISIQIATPTDIIATPNDSPSSQVSSTESTSSIVSDWTVEISDTKLLDDPMVLNIMLFGSDTRFVENAGNSDTMILLSIDNRHQKIKFTSFMRDTWINIPGYGPNKMNASYSYGGPSLAIETIERNYGIKIDRYAVVDFSSFIEIIDTLGGIDIELTDFEIAYINKQLYGNRQSDTNETITAPAGIVHLNGQQALWHARNRDSEMSDFDRTSRQRQVINTVMDRFSNASISTILDAVSKVGPLITTNLKKSEITTLVANSLTYLKYSREECTLPDIYGGNIFIDNAYPTPYGNLSVLLIPDWKQARRDLASFIFEDSLVSNTTSSTSSAVSSQDTSAEISTLG